MRRGCSRRKLERATYDSVAFRFIAANDHPDHDTIASFRRRFFKEIEALFVQVLLLARGMGVLKMGPIGRSPPPQSEKPARLSIAKLSPTGCERRYFPASLSAKRAMVLA